VGEVRLPKAKLRGHLFWECLNPLGIYGKKGVILMDFFGVGRPSFFE
jgi:hypothetical protein